MGQVGRPGEVGPLDLLRVLISRPELDSFPTRLAWAKSQMEHARGRAQMLVLAGGGRAKDSGGDVLMGAVGGTATLSDDSLVWSLEAERSRSELAGDWGRRHLLARQGRQRRQGQQGR